MLGGVGLLRHGCFFFFSAGELQGLHVEPLSKLYQGFFGFFPPCLSGFFSAVSNLKFTPLKTNMTSLENTHFQKEIHLHIWWIFQPAMLVFRVVDN